ncbi:hypothetical protein [Parvicella tangerina]|nr:hypothetical protein [Parvicella tangerina]
MKATGRRELTALVDWGVGGEGLMIGEAFDRMLIVNGITGIA